MTIEEKQEIISIIKETIKSELGTELEKRDTQKLIAALYRKIESIRPFTCSNLNCKNRDSYKQM